MPRPGPAAVPPPHEYGTPICDMPRRITYSDACRPYTRGILPLVKPVGVGASAQLLQEAAGPMLEVTSDEVADIVPRTLLRIAIGVTAERWRWAPCGSVGIPVTPSQFPPLPCGRSGGPGAAGSHRSPGTTPPAVQHPVRPAGADQLRAASSLAWARMTLVGPVE